MAVTGWIHAGMSPAQRATPAALLRGAARGEPLEWLLQTAARELVEAAGSARGGVWLLRGASNLEGILLEAADESDPERWDNVSLNSPEILALMRTSGDEILLRGAESEDMRIGPIAPSAQSLWLPLRNAGKPIGLAMLGWERESAPIDIAPLRMLADALALAAPSALGNSANQPLRISEVIHAG